MLGDSPGRGGGDKSGDDGKLHFGGGSWVLNQKRWMWTTPHVPSACGLVRPRWFNTFLTLTSLFFMFKKIFFPWSLGWTSGRSTTNQHFIEASNRPHISTTITYWQWSVTEKQLGSKFDVDHPPTTWWCWGYWSSLWQSIWILREGKPFSSTIHLVSFSTTQSTCSIHSLVDAGHAVPHKMVEAFSMFCCQVWEKMISSICYS